jgi:hypothetical protein
MEKKALTVKDVVLNILLVVATWLCIRILSYKGKDFKMPQHIINTGNILNDLRAKDDLLQYFKDDKKKVKTAVINDINSIYKKSLEFIDSKTQNVRGVSSNKYADNNPDTPPTGTYGTQNFAKPTDAAYSNNPDTIHTSPEQKQGANPTAYRNLVNKYMQPGGEGVADCVDAGTSALICTRNAVTEEITSLVISDSLMTQWEEFCKNAQCILDQKSHPVHIELHRDAFYDWYRPISHVFNKLYYASDFLARSLRAAAIHDLTSFSKKVSRVITINEKKIPFIDFRKWAKICKDVEFPGKYLIHGDDINQVYHIDNFNTNLFYIGSFWGAISIVVLLITCLLISLSYNREIRGIAYSVATLLLAITTARFLIYLKDVISDQVYYYVVRLRIWMRFVYRVLKDINDDESLKLPILSTIPEPIRNFLFVEHSKEFESKLEIFFDNNDEYFTALQNSCTEVIYNNYLNVKDVNFTSQTRDNPTIISRIKGVINANTQKLSNKQIVDVFFKEENKYFKKLQSISQTPLSEQSKMNIYECGTQFAINMCLFRSVLNKFEASRSTAESVAIITFFLTIVINLAVITLIYLFKYSVIQAGKALNSKIMFNTDVDYFRFVNLVPGVRFLKQLWDQVRTMSPFMVLPFMCGIASAILLTQLYVLIRIPTVTPQEVRKPLFCELAIFCSVVFAVVIYLVECVSPLKMSVYVFMALGSTSIVCIKMLLKLLIPQDRD